MAAKKTTTRATTAKKAAKPEAPVFQQVFKTVDDLLRKDAGCTSELDYTEQSSWLLFLKYLDALEQDREQEAKLTNKKYEYILDKKYRWSIWAAPRNAEGAIDYNTALTGEDLIEFVNGKLFPYLKGFKQRASGTNTIEYKIGEIFDEVRNRMSSGYNLRDIIDQIDRLQFGSQNQKHELSDLYEVKIKNMGNAGRNGGEYYTPRPLIRAIINVVDPRVGDTVYDGAVGSAGFLCEAFEYMSKHEGMTTSKMKTLQEKTFYGKEKKSLAYVIAVMNMILHGIDAPNIVHSNTLGENINLIQEKDRYTVVLANPPFGGKERSEVQQNFPIKTGETAYLFLQHFIKILKAQGRGGVVIKNTTLLNNDNASVALRRHILETCNLHTILDLPSGAFQGAGVRTVVLFFDKGAPTKKIWYYELNVGRNMGKTDPLNDADLAEFIKLQKTKKDSNNSWTVDIADIDPITYDLAVRNPNAVGPVELGTPQDILKEVGTLDARATTLSTELSKMLMRDELESSFNWLSGTLDDLCEVEYGTRVTRKRDGGTKYPVYGGGGATFNLDDFNRQDQMIVSRFAMSEECVRFVAGKFFLNDSGLTVRTRDEKILSQEFLDQQLLARSREIYATARGTAQKNMDMTMFRSMELSYPDSLEEQNRIVARLDLMQVKTSEMMDACDAKLQVAKNLRQSILEAAFAGDL